MNISYNELFSTPSNSIEAFIFEVENQKSTNKASDEWTVKDELCRKLRSSS